MPVGALALLTWFIHAVPQPEKRGGVVVGWSSRRVVGSSGPKHDHRVVREIIDEIIDVRRVASRENTASWPRPGEAIQKPRLRLR